MHPGSAADIAKAQVRPKATLATLWNMLLDICVLLILNSAPADVGAAEPHDCTWGAMVPPSRENSTERARGSNADLRARISEYLARVTTEVVRPRDSTRLCSRY